MSDSFDPIPSSVISEGLDIWEGAGDRGDAAMYLFGCSLFVLTLNRPETTDAYLPALRWCAEFLQRKTLPEGVIFSDSDELEGRCPTDGYANLATSCLTYGGDLLAAGLFDSADPSYAKTLRDRAARLRDAIESYFGETLHGFRCYRYTKGGHDTLRSWICLPLVAEIFDRAEGTMDALYSPYLWTENGMLTCERGPENRNDTAWDRSTLFAFKGGFLSGRTEETWTKLKAYLSARLYGNRVPYPVEAYPENGMRHLSAESALFNRIIVEGMLGYRPLGDGCYRLFPHLPAELSDLSLRGLFLSGKRVDVVFRDGVFTVSVSGKTVARGRNVVPLFFKI